MRDGNGGSKKLFGLLVELLTVLRRITVEIVEAIERWRGDDTERPFIWGSSNYLVKVVGDISFLDRLPGLEQHLGVSIGNNPFLCYVGLDGRPAFLPSNEVNGQGKAIAVAPGKLACAASGSLGVSPERWKQRRQFCAVKCYARWEGINVYVTLVTSAKVFTPVDMGVIVSRMDS